MIAVLDCVQSNPDGANELWGMNVGPLLGRLSCESTGDTRSDRFRAVLPIKVELVAEERIRIEKGRRFDRDDRDNDSHGGTNLSRKGCAHLALGPLTIKEGGGNQHGDVL